MNVRLSGITHNGYVYETFGISKQFPIKLQLLLIRAGTLDNPLTAKCFIYDVCALHEQQCTIRPSSGKIRKMQIFLLKNKRRMMFFYPEGESPLQAR